MNLAHSATVMVKMNLDDSEGVNGADLGISFGEEGLIENREVLD